MFLKWVFYNLCVCFVFYGSTLDKKTLSFSFQKGEILEVKKFANQKIKINQKKITRQVFNYIRLQVLAEPSAESEGGFLLHGRFQSRFRYYFDKDSPYLEEENETSRFTILPNGKYVVEAGLYMPNLRSIPTFPKNMSLKKGFQWTAPAQEIMKFKRLILIPLMVHYEYRGQSFLSTPDGVKKLHKILINYEISKNYPEYQDPEIPSKVFGFATGILFWDEAQQIPYYIQDEYNIVILFPNGNSREFQVKSKTYFKKRRFSKKDTTQSLAKKLQNQLSTNHSDVLSRSSLSLWEDATPKKPTANISVKTKQDEIKINLPDVFFQTDSAALTEESQKVLDAIARIIKKEAPSAQILIRGFTDNRGTQEYNQKLSEKRAKAVARYFTDIWEIPTENISYLGLGEKRPIATNRTAAGRAKNRRVEILLYP